MAQNQEFSRVKQEKKGKWLHFPSENLWNKEEKYENRKIFCVKSLVEISVKNLVKKEFFRLKWKIQENSSKNQETCSEVS